jgi:hypothetical protein
MENAMGKQAFKARFIRIIPITAFVELVVIGNGKIVVSRAAGNHKRIVEL